MLRTLSNPIVALALTTLHFGVVHASTRSQDSSNAGTVISKRAAATYQSEAGERLTVAFTPHETAPSSMLAPLDEAARAFRICNTGNTPDSFAVTHVDVTAPATTDVAYFDFDGDRVVKISDSKIALNEDKCPQLQPGGCAAVLVQIRTNNVALHSTVTMNLAVRSNAARAVNGHGGDIGARMISQTTTRFSRPHSTTAKQLLHPSFRRNGPAPGSPAVQGPGT
jgi:hypothetical protein